MHKRERLTRACAGEAVDRVPVAFWRHFPGDDQRPADLAHAVIEFQTAFDWDFVNLAPAPSSTLLDYGLQDQWQGALDGTRTVLKSPIRSSLDWTQLRPLDPARGEMGKIAEAARLTCEGLPHSEAPILLTIYSPLAQAQMLAGRDLLLRHLRTRTDRIQSGLNVLTESLLRLFDALRRLPIEGIVYVIDHASHELLTEDEYKLFGVPYDLKILDALPERWTYRMFHLRGDALMFKLVSGAPVNMLLWNAAEPDLAQGKSMFSGAVAGGLGPQALLYETPSALRETLRNAASLTNSRRFIAAGPAPIATPLSNLRAIRQQSETL